MTFLVPTDIRRRESLFVIFGGVRLPKVLGLLAVVALVGGCSANHSAPSTTADAFCIRVVNGLLPEIGDGFVWLNPPSSVYVETRLLLGKMDDLGDADLSILVDQARADLADVEAATGAADEHRFTTAPISRWLETRCSVTVPELTITTGE